jgi:hypothetical protein
MANFDTLSFFDFGVSVGSLIFEGLPESFPEKMPSKVPFFMPKMAKNEPFKASFYVFSHR